MIKSTLYITLFATILLGFSSCKKENTAANNITSGSEYFSSLVGMTRLYQVDSIYWDDFFNTHDTISYQVKEVIPSTYFDNQNRITQRIERYLKNPITGEWIIWKVWHANITNSTAELVEDNIRYLKFVINPKLNATWNGNTYNNLDVKYYKITALNVADFSGNNSYASTLKISQYDDENLNAIHRDFDEERYAKGVGLYYRTNEHYEKTFKPSSIKSGYIYTETLLSYSYHP